MNDTDKQFTGRVFAAMFWLAFLYMGALSSALEGWTLAFTIFSWAGMASLIALAVGSVVSLFTDRPE